MAVLLFCPSERKFDIRTYSRFLIEKLVCMLFGPLKKVLPTLCKILYVILLKTIQFEWFSAGFTDFFNSILDELGCTFLRGWLNIDITLRNGALKFEKCSSKLLKEAKFSLRILSVANCFLPALFSSMIFNFHARFFSFFFFFFFFFRK